MPSWQCSLSPAHTGTASDCPMSSARAGIASLPTPCTVGWPGWRTRGLLAIDKTFKKAPLSPLGYTAEHRYTLQAPFGPIGKAAFPFPPLGQFPMRASLDETCPELPGGVAYVVAVTIVLADEAAADGALSHVLIEPGRKRPFHWHTEGPKAKERLVACLVALGAVAHVVVHYPTGRRKTEAARASTLREVVVQLVADGVDDLVIESQRSEWGPSGPGGHPRCPPGPGHARGYRVYTWRPKKADRLLWLADGVCGAVRGFLLDDGDRWYYEQLQAARVIGEPIYLSEHTAPLSA